MPDEEKKEKTLPIHELIPILIDETIREEQPGRFLTLLKVVERLKLPKGHDEVRNAITKGKIFFTDLIGHRCDMADAQTYIEEGNAAMKEAEKELASEPPSKETAKTPFVGPNLGDTSGLSDA